MEFLVLLVPVLIGACLIWDSTRTEKVKAALAAHRDIVLAGGAAGHSVAEIARTVSEAAGMTVTDDEVKSAVKAWRNEAMKADKFRQDCITARNGRAAPVAAPADNGAQRA